MGLRSWFRNNKNRDVRDIASDAVPNKVKDAGRSVDNWTADNTPTFRKAGSTVWQGTKLAGNMVADGAAAAGVALGGGIHKTAKGMLQLSGRFTFAFAILAAIGHYILIMSSATPVILFDSFGSFIRTFVGSLADGMFVYYVLLGALAGLIFYRDSSDPFFLRQVLKFIAFSTVAYILPIVIRSFMDTASPTLRGTLLLLLIFSPLWLYYIFANPGDRFTPVLSFLFFLGLTVVIIIELLALVQASGYQPQQGSPAVSLREAWSYVVGAAQKPITSTQSAYQRFKEGWSGQVNRTTQDFYVGTVDQSQGAPLGVFVEQPQVDYQKFYLDQGDSVTATAVLKARSLVDEAIVVQNECHMEVTDATSLRDIKSVNISGTVIPKYSSFVYTADFQDRQDIQCSIPNAELKKYFIENRLYTGTIVFHSTFNFTTLAYMPYAFMDRDLFVAMRRDNLEPANEMSIKANPLAVYTPGPMMIGMARDTQPFTYTQGVATASLPAFGVTFGSSTYGKGALVEMHELHLYLPKQFKIDQPKCTPTWLANTPATEENKPRLKETKDWNENDLYTDYHIANASIQREDTFLTVRCPLLATNAVDPVSNRALPIIGPAGASLFTFYAKANYSYRADGRTIALVQGVVPPTPSDPTATASDTTSSGTSTSTTTSTSGWPSDAPAKGSAPFSNKPNCLVTNCHVPSGETLCSCEMTINGVRAEICSWRPKLLAPPGPIPADQCNTLT